MIYPRQNSQSVFDSIAWSILNVPPPTSAPVATEFVWVYWVRQSSVKRCEDGGIVMLDEFWKLIENLLHHAVVTCPFDTTSMPLVHAMTLRMAPNWRTIARGYNLAHSLPEHAVVPSLIPHMSPQVPLATLYQRTTTNYPFLRFSAMEGDGILMW